MAATTSSSSPDSKARTAIAAAVLLAIGLAAGWGLSRWQAQRMAGADHSAHGAIHASGSVPVATAAAERKVLYWYDPMVPSQKFDKPGKSPFMDMQLVPKYADEADAQSKGVVVSPQAQQSLGLRVARAETVPVSSSVDAVGTVLLNEREVSVLQARAAGFVERTYGRAPGDVVAAGAPIVDVLLPEWLSAQQEFLAVRATGDATLAAAARNRLVLLGMSNELIERVAASGQPEALQTLTAPIGGVIAELMVRQGMTVGMNMALVRINGLNTVWVEAAVPELMAATVAPGQAAEVRLPATPGQVIKGRVAAVLPEANRDTRTLRVRVELPNPGFKLRAGMFAQVALKGAPQGDAVAMPMEAVVRTGKRALVYVLDAPGRYRPVEVELGAEMGERVVVRRGVQAGQQVVSSGQFLIDSEASLQGITARAAAQAGAGAGAPAAVEHEVGGTVVGVAAKEITLDHDAVPAIKWPRMTMPFQLARPELAKGLKPGDKVIFKFRQQGDDSIVTSIKPAAGAAAGDPHAGHGAAAAAAAASTAGNKP
jgi:Cu(I)/Ag(I) efflux system membrane fusion protein